MRSDDVADFRPLNVTLGPASKALKAYAKRAGIADETLAAGFKPRPDLDLTNHRGRTISDLCFFNCYLGGGSSWSDSDRSNIDTALADAMTDAGLQEIVAQYYQGPIASHPLGSKAIEKQLGAKFFKDNAEQLLVELIAQGIAGNADPTNTVINMMLPEGVILVDGNSDGSEDAEPEHAKAVLVDDEQADSTQGLGGYHGSVAHNGGFIYYAVGVYSKGANGIPAFDEPWKNIVATFYHELVEARTDPDVEDVIRTGNSTELGWYSRRGGEIGDIPMTLAGRDLSLVMKELVLGNGKSTPVQLMWSNHAHGPAEPKASALA